MNFQYFKLLNSNANFIWQPLHKVFYIFNGCQSLLHSYMVRKCKLFSKNIYERYNLS